jgi:hypothetical protein
MTKCSIEKCCHNSYCEIIDITKKQPASFEACSYAKTNEQHEKFLKKITKVVDTKRHYRKLRKD